MGTTTEREMREFMQILTDKKLPKDRVVYMTEKDPSKGLGIESAADFVSYFRHEPPDIFETELKNKILDKRVAHKDSHIATSSSAACARHTSRCAPSRRPAWPARKMAPPTPTGTTRSTVPCRTASSPTSTPPTTAA